MSKEKKIEEIKQVIDNYYHNGNASRKKSLSEQIYDTIINEDEVVISKEEYERLKREHITFHTEWRRLYRIGDLENKFMDKTHKETVEESLKFVDKIGGNE